MRVMVIVCALFCTVKGYAAESLSVSGSPGLFTINSAAAGSNPNPVTNSSTTYSGQASTSTTIVGVINTSMPTGVTLKIQLQAPTGATSAGLVTMSTTSSTLVSGITNSTWTSLPITYQLSATAAAAIQSNVSRTVTFTLQ